MAISLYQIFMLLISSFLLMVRLLSFDKFKEIKFATAVCALFLTLCYLAWPIFNIYILVNAKSSIALFYASLISIYITTKRQKIREINEEKPYIAIYKKTALMIGFLGVSISCCFFIEVLYNISVISGETTFGFREIESVQNNYLPFLFVLLISGYLLYESHILNLTDGERLYFTVFIPFAFTSFQVIYFIQDSMFILMEYIWLLSIVLSFASSILARVTHVKVELNCLERGEATSVALINAHTIFLVSFFVSWIAVIYLFLSIVSHLHTIDVGLHLLFINAAMSLPIITALIYWAVRFFIMVKHENVSIESIHLPSLLVHFSALMSVLAFAL